MRASNLARWITSASVLLGVGCGGALVAAMSPEERAGTCIDGGRRASTGEPYPARVRVPTCLKAADDASDDATRQFFRAKACSIAYAELSKAPDGMSDADCIKASNVASSSGGALSLRKDEAAAISQAACKHAGNAESCKSTTKEERESAPSLEVSTDGNKVMASLKTSKECRASDGNWQPCGVQPIPNAELVFASVLLEVDPNEPWLKATTDQEGRASFDLSNVSVNPLFGAKTSFGVGEYTDAQVRYNPQKGGQLSKRIDLSSCPLYATWRATAEKKRGVASVAKAEEDKKNQEALEHNKGECTKGNGEACYRVGMALDDVLVENRTSDKNPGAPYMRRACELKHSTACTTLGVWKKGLAAGAPAASTSFHGAETVGRELEPLKGKCSAGDASSCAAMNWMVRCTQGLSDGCDSMGNAYFSGTGVSKDVGRTTSYWARACQIDAAKCAGYATEILRRQEFPAREETAESFFDRGCKGDANQCLIIGAMLWQGAGVSQDTAKARTYFKRACDANIAAGCQAMNRTP